MIHQVLPVNTLLKVVSASVWNEARRQYVNFADTPRIESRLRKCRFKDIVAANLHVAETQAKSSDSQISRQRAVIIVVKNPAHRVNPSVQTGYFNGFDFQELVVLGLLY